MSLCNSNNGNAIADKLERDAVREGGVYWIVKGIIFPVGGVEINFNSFEVGEGGGEIEDISHGEEKIAKAGNC